MIKKARNSPVPLELNWFSKKNFKIIKFIIKKTKKLSILVPIATVKWENKKNLNNNIVVRKPFSIEVGRQRAGLI